ncbi:hypothetical protein [Barnesiella viscericola]|uniref:hypothetical protein n=1 Tax=Barnesiella viscericola TaxID=397865 RepID=UPI0024B74EF4|nr:hypothetical protein [Barnesiella viscericola]
MSRSIDLELFASENTANLPQVELMLKVNVTVAFGAIKSSCWIFPLGFLGIETFVKSSKAPEVENDTIFPQFPSVLNVGASYPSRGF